MATVYDFDAALDLKNAEDGVLTDIRMEEDGSYIAVYQDLTYRAPCFDSLMMQLGWFDEIDIVDTDEVLEVVSILQG